jgi:hypothetical protein
MDIVTAAVTANCSQRLSGRGYAQVSNGRSLRRLLCARRDRCRAPEKRDELAPFHSTTSSARPSSEIGKVMPSVLAVLRLRINSTFVDCCATKPKADKPPLPPDEERDRQIKALKTRVQNLTAELKATREWKGGGDSMNFVTMSAISKCLHPDHEASEEERTAGFKLFTAWKADKAKAQRKGR